MRAPLPPALAAALALAAVLRLALVGAAGGSPERLVTLDGEGYLALARDLEGGYLDRGSSAFGIGLLYPPGYPAFAGAVLRLGGGSPRALAAAQGVLSLATLALLYALAARLLGRGAAAVAVLLLGADPASAIYSVVAQPEALFAALVLASAAALVRAAEGRHAWAAAAGLCVAAALLVRPIAVLLPVAAAAAVAALAPAGRRATLAALVLLPGLLAGGAWVARNRAVTGTAFFAGIEGANGLYYRAAGALAASEGIPVEVARARLGEEERRRGAGLDRGGRIRLQQRMTVEVLARHPLGALRAALQGWLRLLAGTGLSALSAIRGDPDPEGTEGAKPALNLLLAAPLAVTLLGALLAAVVLLRPLSAGERAALALAGCYLAYFLALSSFLEANTRFRVPIAPFLCLLAGLGLTRVRGGLAGGRDAGAAPPPA